MFKRRNRLLAASVTASAFAIFAPHIGVANPLLVQVQAPSPEQEKRIEEEKKKADELKRQRGDQEHKKAEQEQQHQKTEQDKQRGEQQQRQKAEQEQQHQKTEQDKQRGEQQQRQKADQDLQHQKAEQDKQRAEQQQRQKSEQAQQQQKAEQDRQRAEQLQRQKGELTQQQQKAEQDKQRAVQTQKNADQQRAQAQQGQAAQREGLLKRQLSDADRRAEQEREARKQQVQALADRQKQQASQERRQDQIDARLRAENERLKSIRAERHETRDARGQTVINEGNRTIYQYNNQVFIQHTEVNRFEAGGGNVQRRQGPNGDSISLFSRPDGSRIEIEFDGNNRPLRRVRILPDGRRFTLFENTALAAGGAFAFGSFVVDLPEPRYSIPREEYIVDAGRASEDDIYTAFEAPPLEPLARTYTLDEVRASVRLRERMRSINIDSINFEFGAFEVPGDQFALLEQVASVLKDIIDRNPGEVFLIEGYTDAVGSDIDNLSLSDRRAESVATVLSREFRVPAESMVTQGYGKQFLLIPTDGPERRNRRVVIRRITPLLTTDNSNGYR